MSCQALAGSHACSKAAGPLLVVIKHPAMPPFQRDIAATLIVATAPSRHMVINDGQYGPCFDAADATFRHDARLHDACWCRHPL
jgi:hypothetical protein